MEYTSMTKHPIALAIALSFATSATLSACDSASRLTPEEHVQRAKDYESKGELISAIIELKNALEKNPQNSQARLLLGNIYVENGDGASAEKELSIAQKQGVTAATVAVPLANALLLQGRPKDVLAKLTDVTGLSASGMAELHVVKGKSYLGLGELQHAEEEFHAALNSQPDSPIAWHGQAVLAYTKQQWDEASRWNEKVLANNPKSAQALGLKGDIALARNDAKGAEVAYGSAVKLRPDYALYRIGLAIAQINTGKYPEAKGQLDTVLKSFPNDLTANYYRALAAYQLKDYEGAKVHSELVLNNNPSQEDLRSRLVAAGANYALGQMEAANKHLQIFLARVPSYEPARMLQAAIQLRMGKTGDAAASLKGISSSSENDVQLLNAVGVAALQQGKSDLGLEILQRVAEKNPDDPAAKIRVGLARSAKGDYQEAIDDFEQALRMDPKLVGAEALVAMNHLKAGNADEALKAARRFQQGVPNSPDGYTLAGLAQVMKKQYAEAKASFNKALSIQPGNPNASQNLASLALADGDREQARRLLQASVQKYPGHVPTTLRLADMYWQDGQAKQAETTLSDGLKKNPAALNLRLALGNLYLAQREPAMALKLADEAAPSHPNNASILEHQGLAQMQLGQTNLAISAFENAVKLAPNNPSIHFQLARSYEQIGNLSRANQELQATLKISPKHGPARFAQARLLAKTGKLDAAQKMLAELSATYPNDPMIQETRGDLALAQNKPKEAMDFYKAALAKQENNYLTVRLAAAQMRSGDRAGGLNTLQAWLKRYPDDLYTHGSLADAFLATGQHREAAAHYEKVVQGQPENVAVLNNLAWIYQQIGDTNKALTYAQRAHKLAPKQPNVLDTYAMILLSKGNAAGALEKLRAANELAKGDFTIRLHLAQALIANNNPAQARQILNELLDSKIPVSQRQQAQELLKTIK
jgi:putative PEP-CTERM system TPR-repeat lipoprotein